MELLLNFPCKVDPGSRRDACVTVQPKNAIIYSWVIFPFTFDNTVELKRKCFGFKSQSLGSICEMLDIFSF